MVIRAKDMKLYELMAEGGVDISGHRSKDAKIEEEALDCYRRVRDEILAYVRMLPESLEKKG